MECRNASSSYSPNSIVTAFHNIPHFDINLKEVSPDFAVSFGYFEPIIIWACIPIVACLCIFILLSVYFICVCCCCCCREKKPRSKASNFSCAFMIFILALFCMGLIGAIFYAEVSLDKNIKSFIGNGENVVSDIQEVSSSVNKYNGTSVTSSINYVINAINGQPPSSGKDAALTAAQLIDEVNEDVESAFNSIGNGVGSISYNQTIDKVQEFETIRNWTVIGFFIAVGCVLLLICIASLCMSKVCVSCMLVLLSLVTALVWIGTGGILASSIVVADVCHDPDSLIRNQTTDTTARDLVDYFISCNPSCRPDDLNVTDYAIKRFKGAEDNVEAYLMSADLPDAINEFAVVQNEFTIAESIYNNASNILTCIPSQGLREYYTSALNSFCKEGELYIVIILSLCGGLALSLFLLLCCLTCLDGLLINTSHEDEIDNDDIVAFDTERTSNWSSGGRRLSYTEPYSNGRYREEVRMSGLGGSSPPKYNDLGRPSSGEYDHFDV